MTTKMTASRSKSTSPPPIAFVVGGGNTLRATRQRSDERRQHQQQQQQQQQADNHDNHDNYNGQHNRCSNRRRNRSSSRSSCHQQWWRSSSVDMNGSFVRCALLLTTIITLKVLLSDEPSSSSLGVFVCNAFEVPHPRSTQMLTSSTTVSRTLSTTLPSKASSRRRTKSYHNANFSSSSPSSTVSSSSPTTTTSALNLWPKHLFFDSVGSDGTVSQSSQAHTVVSDPPLASLVDVGSAFRLARTEEDVIEKLEVGQRLICLGDVHGDYEALMKALEVARVYDRQSNCWIGGNTIVVQTGDILDRGTQELACYSLLAKLSQEAPAVGGRVVLLTGNHEIMNAIGNFDYVTHDLEFEASVGQKIDENLRFPLSPSSSSTTTTSGELLEQTLSSAGPPQWRVQYGGNHPARWTCFEPGGLLVAPLMSNMKVAFQVGKTVCVHAGLRASHIQENGGIAGMNKAYRDWILMSQQQGSNRNSIHENGEASSESREGASDGTTSPSTMKSPVKYNHLGKYSSDEELYSDVQRRYWYYQQTLPSFLNDPKGPIWMRNYSSPSGLPPKDPLPTQTMLENTLAELNANRMVMGHTIQKQINAVMDGKAWRVDIGMSAYCGGGRPEVLEIVGVSESGGERVSVLTEDGEVTASDRFVQSYASLM